MSPRAKTPKPTTPPDDAAQDVASSHVRALSDGQSKVLAFIREFEAAHGRMPSMREIGEGLRFTRWNAFAYVKRLRRAGALPAPRDREAPPEDEIAGGIVHTIMDRLGRRR